MIGPNELSVRCAPQQIGCGAVQANRHWNKLAPKQKGLRQFGHFCLEALLHRCLFCLVPSCFSTIWTSAPLALVPQYSLDPSLFSLGAPLLKCSLAFVSIFLVPISLDRCRFNLVQPITPKHFRRPFVPMLGTAIVLVLICNSVPTFLVPICLNDDRLGAALQNLSRSTFFDLCLRGNKEREA